MTNTVKQKNIPNGWSSTELGLVSDITMGQSPSSENYNQDQVGLPFFQGKADFTENLGVKVRQWTSEVTKESKPGDILMSVRAPVGDVAINSVDACIGRGLAAIRGKEDVSEQQFLFQALQYLKDELNKKAQGSTFTAINGPSLKKIQIILPPLFEQKKIAEILSAVDAEIAKTDQIISATEKLKKGLMQKFFTNSVKNEASILGHYLIEKPSYGINAPAVNYSETLPTYIRITDISEQGQFISENKKSVDHKDYQNYLLQEGDFLFARTGASVGKTYLYDPKDGQLVFAGFLIRVKTDSEKLLPKYLSYFTQTSMYWSWVRTTSMRSGQPGVNGNEYSRMPISAPSVKEQEKVTRILSSIDEKIFLNQKLKEKLTLLKKGLMKDLLTGKVRTI